MRTLLYLFFYQKQLLLDSTLIINILFLIANMISTAFLPTPEKTILLGGIFAFKALLSSPIETTSAPEPNEENVFI